MKIRTILCILSFVVNSILPAEPKIFTVAPPKTGNHMLVKLVGLITKKPRYAWSRGLANVNEPQINSLRGTTLSSHALFVERNVTLIRKHNFIAISVDRDPRDQTVSMAYWTKKTMRNHQNKSIETLITELITDGSTIYGPTFLRAPEINDIRGVTDFYDLYLPWRDEPYMYVTTFEKLIGPRGGGDKETQLTEIQNIAHHLGYTMNREEAEEIAKKLWGGTRTFRSGQIGSWKTHFTAQHKELFKKVAGQLLIDLGYEADMNW